MPTCYLALGSNLENRKALLRTALGRLNAAEQIRLKRTSDFYETRAVGGPVGQPDFLNLCCEIETTLDPIGLLDTTQKIETDLGRIRTEKWAARLIDIDILVWGDLQLASDRLTIPHPLMHIRRFVLEPLAEIAPQLRHPAGWSVIDRFDELAREPRYIAITGPMGVGKSTLAERLAERLAATVVKEEFDAQALERIYGGDLAAGASTQSRFLLSRQELLRRDKFVNVTGWVVSDFWFFQSLAYRGAVMEDSEEAAEHRAELEDASEEVLAPTLVVWLDAATETLLERIERRGRSFETSVTVDFLDSLRAGYHALFPQQLPVYRPGEKDPTKLVDELVDVANAMASQGTRLSQR